MFVFQVGTQKQKQPELPQKAAIQVFTGKDAQRILAGVMNVAEPLLLKIHK